MTVSVLAAAMTVHVLAATMTVSVQACVTRLVVQVLANPSKFQCQRMSLGQAASAHASRFWQLVTQKLKRTPTAAGAAFFFNYVQQLHVHLPAQS